MSSPRTWRRAAGFTLIEILIAFAILTIALVTLFRAFSDGLAATGRAESVSAAVLLARSTLERVGTEIPLQEGRQAGVAGGGAEWMVEVGRSSIIDQTALGDVPVAPYEVRITVTVRDARPVVLTTLRLGPAPQSAPR